MRGRHRLPSPRGQRPRQRARPEQSQHDPPPRTTQASQGRQARLRMPQARDRGPSGQHQRRRPHQRPKPMPVGPPLLHELEQVGDRPADVQHAHRRGRDSQRRRNPTQPGHRVGQPVHRHRAPAALAPPARLVHALLGHRRGRQPGAGRRGQIQQPHPPPAAGGRLGDQQCRRRRPRPAMRAHHGHHRAGVQFCRLIDTGPVTGRPMPGGLAGVGRLRVGAELARAHRPPGQRQLLHRHTRSHRRPGRPGVAVGGGHGVQPRCAERAAST